MCGRKGESVVLRRACERRRGRFEAAERPGELWGGRRRRLSAVAATSAAAAAACVGAGRGTGVHWDGGAIVVGDSGKQQ